MVYVDDFSHNTLTSNIKKYSLPLCDSCHSQGQD